MTDWEKVDWSNLSPEEFKKNKEEFDKEYNESVKNCLKQMKEWEEQREKYRKERYERSSPSERLMIDHLDNCQRCMDWLHDKMEFFMANINFNEHSDNWDKEEEYMQSLYNTIHRIHEYHQKGRRNYH
jgi:hypothetical protein